MPDYRNLRRRSVVYPAPTLSAGRPVSWTKTSEVEEEWGRFKVTIDGVDYSTYRDAPTIIESYGNAEHFGDATARLRFPKATPYDTLAAPLAPWGKVEIRRTLPAVNLLTANQASIETDATGWENDANATVTRSTAAYAHGSASLSLTAAAGGDVRARIPTASAAAVTAGTTYTAQASFKTAATARSVRLDIRWYDVTNVLLSTTTGTAVTDSATVWAVATTSAAAPTNATKAVLVLVVLAAAISEVHYADKMGIAASTSTVWTLPQTGGGDSEPLFVGLIAAFEESWDDKGMVATCMGAVHQVGLYRRAPVPDDSAVDIRNLISGQFDNNPGFRPHLRTNTMATTPATGITSRYRGSWETVDQYISKLLELAIKADGDMWTVLQDYPANPWTPTLELKDRTTVNWTIVCNQPGTEGSRLQRELSSGFNVIYGEGEYGGSRYRNFYELGGSAVFQPFAYHNDVHSWDPNGSGGLTDTPARIVNTAVRIEGWQGFGSGVTYTEAGASAEQQRLRAQDVGYVGNIRLEADPQEGHRLAIRAGDNIRVKSHHGADRLFHIAAVDVSMGESEPVVTLTVDTQARDYPTLAAIIERDREVSRKPLARLTGRTFEGQPTSRATWDDNTGSGWVPTARKFDGTSTVALAAGWNIVKFRASERDTVWKIQANTTVARKFSLAIFNGLVTAAELPTDPFANGAWQTYTATDRYIIHWGQYNVERAAQEGAGYYPGYETDGAALTGNFVDDAPWVYHHDNGIDADAQQYLWAAIFVVGGTTNFWMKLTRGPGLA